MTCQHTFSPATALPASRRMIGEESRAILFNEEAPAILFRPILDTVGHRLLAHDCVVHANEPLSLARIHRIAIQAAAEQNRHGLYFFQLSPAEIDDPEDDLWAASEAIHDAGLLPRNAVFDIAESDLARDRGHSMRIREYLRARGFSFALSGAGVAAGDLLANIRDFTPEYIRVEKRLLRSLDRPASSAAVSLLTRAAERIGADLIADGVDRIRMLENLWLLGIRFMQGDLFGRLSPHVLQ